MMVFLPFSYTYQFMPKLKRSNTIWTSSFMFQTFPVAASTLSLVAIAADRCGAVRRGGTLPCARPLVAVLIVWTIAFLSSKFPGH